MSEQPRFWFPAKRYGLGWGLPVRWQGWVVLAVYAALLYGGIHYFDPEQDARGLLIYMPLLTLALIGVVALKGERPVRWRWGRAADDEG